MTLATRAPLRARLAFAALVVALAAAAGACRSLEGRTSPPPAAAAGTAAAVVAGAPSLAAAPPSSSASAPALAPAPSGPAPVVPPEPRPFDVVSSLRPPALRLVLPWNGRTFAPTPETEPAVAAVTPPEDDPG